MVAGITNDLAWAQSIALVVRGLRFGEHFQYSGAAEVVQVEKEGWCRLHGMIA